MVPIKQIRHVIPINSWNKRTKGQERGKTPIHEDWVTKKYNTTQKHIDRWVKNGSNIGYRIPKNAMVVDIDPRNGAGRRRRLELAELFGYKSFKKFLSSTYSTKTGGGGWHLYFKLPKGVKYKRLVEHHEDFKGIEFKKYGRQCLLAPSRHPNGDYYKELNNAKFATAPKLVLEVLKRDVYEGATVGGGEFTPLALSELLQHLPPEDYDTNDKWEPLLMAAHHATGGVGIEEFVEWSRSDPTFDDIENELMIRRRWDSCDVNRKDGRTYKSLCYELELRGEDSKGFRARAEFKELDNSADPDEEVDEPFDEEEDPDAGQKLEAEAHMINTSTSSAELMVFMRKAQAVGGGKATFAHAIAANNCVLTKSEYNRMLKDLRHSQAEDIPRRLTELVLAETYNNGENILYLNNGSLWLYRKTHWIRVNEEYVKGVVLAGLDANYRKLAGDETLSHSATAKAAFDLLRMRAAVDSNLVLDDAKKLSIINCRNGELWLNSLGRYRMRKHKHDSYLINVLPIKFDDGAECPYWKARLLEIMQGDKHMVSYLQEIFGYMMQPDKNIASWYLFRGQGGDGKSTVLKVLGAVLGDAMHKATPALLALDNKHAMAPLVGKLCVAIEELPVSYRLPDSSVKMLSERTMMEADPKGKETFNFEYVAGLVMCCNGWPKVIDLSDGMRRRANVLEFNATFESVDLDVAQRVIDTELPGVLVWALKGLQRLRKRGKFDVPKKSKSATEVWFNKSHLVTSWFSEMMVKVRNPKKKMALEEAYNLFVFWCDAQGFDKKPISKNFKSDVISMGVEVRIGTGGRNYLFGVKKR